MATYQIVRELAARHKVRQADVLELAVVHLVRGLGEHIQLPDGWEPFLELEA